jgi:hypothetical protein
MAHTVSIFRVEEPDKKLASKKQGKSKFPAICLVYFSTLKMEGGGKL